MVTTGGNASMAQRIAHAMPRLTAAHRQVADYVLAHPLQTATMPIDELAAAAGVSIATANRFARALDFEGYAQFRAALVLGFETTLAPVERLRSKVERRSTVADVFAHALDDITANIDTLRASIDARSCEQAVAAILKARRIYVLGLGSSSWLAGLLQRNLDVYCDSVQLLSSIESASFAARVMTRLTANDLLIAIGFPRYFSDTVLLARRARRQGVPVLALTDVRSSPLAPLATVALYARTESQYFANSEASVLALIEALSSAVAYAAPDAVKKAAALTDAVAPWIVGPHARDLRQPLPAPARRARKAA